MANPFALKSFRLDLTNSTWLIYAVDTQAEHVVSALGNVMSFSPVLSENDTNAKTKLHKIYVVVDARSCNTETTDSGPEPIICRVPSPDNDDLLLSGMMSVARTIVQAEESRGGLLIHGALAESPTHPGEGILLAGPSSAGKTTASNRLPLPWRSLSDDTTFMVSDTKGRYWAHPWPTWSRFYSTPSGHSGPGGKWNVEKGMPLKAIFFLGQSEEERIIPLSLTPALTYLMETVQQVSRPPAHSLPDDQGRSLQEQKIATAEELVRNINTYTLHISLTGSFWKDIETTLTKDFPVPLKQSDDLAGSTINPEHKENNSQAPHRDNDVLTVNYSGPSMNPTLRHPDLLEVHPYAEESIKPGDVIYFKSPEDGAKVVHRVVRVATNGFFTQGDNNPATDQYLLKRCDIVGKVTAAWRNGKHRKIPGGFLGKCIRFTTLLKRQIRTLCSFFLHRMYRGLASSGLFRYLLPVNCRPRVFEFKQRNLPPILKLIVNGHVIGHYDILKELWVIQLPWRLIIDETNLPVGRGLNSTEEPEPAGDLFAGSKL